MILAAPFDRSPEPEASLCLRVEPPVLVALLRLALLLLAALLCVSSGAVRQPSPTHPALRDLPLHMAWAWERDEDLRWLSADAGVAYVQMSVWLEGERIVVRPRANALLLRPSTALVPIVHVDASIQAPPALTTLQRDAIVGLLQRAAADSPSKVVQLDFEARRSQRAFLADVVRAARIALPANVALSVTALASWCAGDAWMNGLPADEIVPMAFRMARDSASLRSLLAKRGAFAPLACRSAIGIATDEPLAELTAPRRYVFSPRRWTAAAWHAHPF